MIIEHRLKLLLSVCAVIYLVIFLRRSEKGSVFDHYERTTEITHSHSSPVADQEAEDVYGKEDNPSKTFPRTTVCFIVIALSWLWKKRAKIHSRITKAQLVLAILTWAFCACVAPFFYVPENQIFLKTQGIPPPAVEVSDRKKSSRRIPKRKNKSAETTGSQNRRVKAEAIKYATTREKTKIRKREAIQRAKKLVLSYHARCQRNGALLLTRTNLIGQSNTQVERLQRELVVLENTITVMKDRIESQKYLNKQIIEKYETIHQQLSSLARV